jgi:hypothetical protein
MCNREPRKGNPVALLSSRPCERIISKTAKKTRGDRWLEVIQSANQLHLITPCIGASTGFSKTSAILID